MKSSKCEGSSLFQNTVGIASRLQCSTKFTNSWRGAREPVIWYCQAPWFPAHADSTNNKSIGSASSSFCHPFGVRITVWNSGVHARNENSSHITTTLKPPKTVDQLNCCPLVKLRT